MSDAFQYGFAAGVAAATIVINGIWLIILKIREWWS